MNEGERLSQRIKREGKLTTDETMRIMIRLIDIVESVHKSGMIHRDIAPINVFLGNDGEVELLGFECATSIKKQGEMQLPVMLRDGYSAEEQYWSKGVQGTWTDVYSLAAVMYKMLTGTKPMGALERKIKDTLKPPSKCGADTSPKVDAAIMHALKVKVKERTKTMKEFRKELI